MTSNRGFADQVVAGAIIDRLLHHSTVPNIRGKSYRIRAHPNTKTGGDATIR